MRSALTFHSVRKSYGRHPVLDGVSFAVEPGEFFGLVGLNGAGKTTLLKALLDFVHLDGGAIQVFGTDHRETRARTRLAYLPERFVPPYFLTGRAFLTRMASWHGVTCGSGRLEALADGLDLEPEALDRPVRELSKGMAQKLGLASCLLSGRELLVLDEPMSGLDPKARSLLKQRLRELQARGVTVFFSTHLLEDVDVLCDRMAVLHGGRVRFLGTPRDCARRHDALSLEQAFLACLAAPGDQGPLSLHRGDA